ncbi:ABC1 family-domain-containing protein [Filobasidium floriforme]|uniref:ABC1 family-domain-containing protein n=1 Tax=Filobasidium floriforme TaxID=5210 RepID=UPI001E8DEBE3|nr:ABC1 family-domain-containing protein [Filobasidium floriforme]KAH8078324.1 ABC1 family-domain-containing protein [Filobasidium floriforme]
MFKAFARVAARSIAIQLEEAAAAAKAKQPYVDPTPKIHQYSAASKGKRTVDEDRSEEPPSQQLESGVPQASGTQQAEAVREEDVTKVIPIPGSREARQENPYIRKWPEGPPATSSARPVVPSQSSSSAFTPQAEPIVTSGSAIEEPVVEQKDQASITLEPTRAEPDEAPIEPSQLIDDVDTETAPVTLRPSKVPSSRLGRLFHYGSLVAGLSVGAASEAVRRTTGGGSEGSLMMSEANVRRLVGKLSQMRGAALKLGQFMSIQDTNMLPEQLERVLQQVQANADYMPDWQLERVMRAELGDDWESHFTTFPRVPMAAASIGQVHRAVLKSTGQEVAVKVQFPGIHNSITSDLNNISLLLRTSAILPRGLYLNNTISVFRKELADECDYILEADNQRKMKRFLEDQNEQFFEVPAVIDELSTQRVLTTEIQPGKPLSQIKQFDQALRDKIGTAVLRLCITELFQFRLMQTDPNWANFLYDRKRDKLGLIDFGATRSYSVEFMDNWYRLLSSVIAGDRAAMQKYSLEVGYLTGEEHQDMVDAHLRSMELLAEPFTKDSYDFAHQSVTDEVRKLIPVMLKHRLTPPPNETYSLNRKLSGSFLLCAKLGSKVNCRKIWEDVVGNYKPTTGA